MNSTNNSLYSVRFDIGAQHDVQEDFSLPDYMPEVRQIISHRGTVLPENVFVDQNELVMSGLVMYTVIYIGDNGKLTSTDLNSEYTVRLSCNGCDMTGLSAEHIPFVTQLVACTCRATGPRRLSLSARMNSKAVSAVQGKHAEIITDRSDGGERSIHEADELSLERHVTEVNSADMSRHRITGTVSGSFREKNDSKIISCYSTAGVTDIRQSDRSVKVMGNVFLSCLFMTTDGKYYSVKERCPFEDTVSLSHSPQKSPENSSAAVRCAGMNICCDENGDYKWDLEYDVDVVCNIPHTSTLTDDIYSTSYETFCESEDLSGLVCLKNGNSRLSLNSSVVLNRGGEKEVCHAVAKVTVDRSEYTADGKLTVNGACTVQTIIDSEGTLKAEDVTIPVKFECMGMPISGMCHTICSLDVMNAGAKLDGDKLTVDAELCITYLAYAISKTQCISSCIVDLSAPLERGASCVRVYFPEENETLWDIGKKYHCKAESIEVLGKNMPVIINV